MIDLDQEAVPSCWWLAENYISEEHLALLKAEIHFSSSVE